MCLRWRHRHPNVTKDDVFFLFIPLSHQNLHSLLLPGNKRDQKEILTQFAEWCQFMVQHIPGNLTYFTGGFRSSNILCNGEQILSTSSALQHVSEAIRGFQLWKIPHTPACVVFRAGIHALVITGFTCSYIRAAWTFLRGLLRVSNADSFFCLVALESSLS